MALVPNNYFTTDGGRTRAFNADGIQAVRGGQTVASSFFESVFNCYSLLVYHPFASIFFGFGVFILLAEYHNAAGPLEGVQALFATASTLEANAKFARTLFSVFAYLLAKLVVYKIVVGKLALVWYPYLVKPSQRHMYSSIILTIMVFIMSMSYIEVVVLSQLYFLYVTLRAPLFKLSVLIVFVCIFVAGIIPITTTPKATTTSGWLIAANGSSVPYYRVSDDQVRNLKKAGYSDTEIIHLLNTRNNPLSNATLQKALHPLPAKTSTPVIPTTVPSTTPKPVPKYRRPTTAKPTIGK